MAKRMMLALKEGSGWDFTGLRHSTKGAIVVYPGKIQKWKPTWKFGIRPIY